MQDRRKRNLRRRRRKIAFLICSGILLVFLMAAGVFVGFRALLTYDGSYRPSGLVRPTRVQRDKTGTGKEGQTTQSSDEETLPGTSLETDSGSSSEEASDDAGTGDFAQDQSAGPEAGSVGEGTSEEAKTQDGASDEAPVAPAPAAPSGPAAVVAVGGVPDPVTIHLVAVGDNLMHRSVSMSGLQPDGSFNYDYNFSKVAPLIQAADLAIINQETVIGGNELGISGYPCFNGRTEMADALVRNGFDVVLGANNHILDQGGQAVLHMIQYFQTNYPQITLLGIHNSWETRDELKVVDCNGIRLAMINYTDLLNIPSNWYGQEYLTDYLDYDRLTLLIQRAKAAADLVVVFPHWGTEYFLGVDAKQQEEVAFLAEQGVDLVIGTHPHVVEPMSYITRPDGGHMLVYYSLGNYQSIQNLEATMIGAMAEVEISKSYAGTFITDFNMHFLANDYRMSGAFLDYYDIVTTYPWEQYSRELAETSWVHYDNPNFSVDTMFSIQAQLQAQVTTERHNAGLE